MKEFKIKTHTPANLETIYTVLGDHTANPPTVVLAITDWTGGDEFRRELSLDDATALQNALKYFTSKHWSRW